MASSDHWAFCNREQPSSAPLARLLHCLSASSQATPFRLKTYNSVQQQRIVRSMKAGLVQLRWRKHKGQGDEEESGKA